MNAYYKGKYEREMQMLEEREIYLQRMSEEQGGRDQGGEEQGNGKDRKTERKKKEKSLKENMKRDINKAQLARETLCGLNFTGRYFSHVNVILSFIYTHYHSEICGRIGPVLPVYSRCEMRTY